MVVAPVDKAINNVFFTYKRFYATNLFEKRSIIGAPSKTCKLISDYNKNILITSIFYEIKQHLISTSENMKDLRLPYWILKTHKSPIGS